jgi:hypothetical protein
MQVDFIGINKLAVLFTMFPVWNSFKTTAQYPGPHVHGVNGHVAFRSAKMRQSVIGANWLKLDVVS